MQNLRKGCVRAPPTVVVAEMKALIRTLCGKASAALALVASACAVPGVEDPYDTLARSSQYETTGTTPPGVVEIELSSAIDPNEASDLGLAVKYGLDERTEAVAEAALLRHRSGETNGPGDLFLHLTRRLWDGSDEGASVAARLSYKLPAGERGADLGTGEADFFAAALAEAPVGPAVATLAYELGVLGDPDGAATDVEHAVALTLAASLAPRFAGFVGADATLLPEADESSSAGRLGFAVSLSPTLLVDAAIALGFDGDTPDEELLVGITWSL